MDRKQSEDALRALRMDAGVYDKEDGGVVALLDQQRADAIERLRKADALSFTVHTPDDNAYVHWAIFEQAGADPEEFLVYAVVRATRDAMNVLEMPAESILRIVRQAIEAGIGA